MTRRIEKPWGHEEIWAETEAYVGKILRVNLTTGTTKDENLPEEPVLKKFIGGQALALYILLHELPLDAKPLGPESKMVLMTGPITGTGLTPFICPESWVSRPKQRIQIDVTNTNPAGNAIDVYFTLIGRKIYV